MNKNFQTENEYSAFLEDNFLRHIGHEHMNQLCNELDQKTEEWKAIEVPQSLNEWFESFHKQEQKRKRKQERRSNLLKIGKKAAILVVFLVGINYVLVSNVDAYRIQWLNTITNIQDKFTQIDFVTGDKEESTSLLPDDWVGNYYPAYLPDGFRLEDSLSNKGISRLQYRDSNENVIVFHQFSLQSSVQVDSEDGKVSQINIGSNVAVLIEKNNSNSISWTVDDFALSISATGVLVDELIKIAENVENKK